MVVGFGPGDWAGSVGPTVAGTEAAAAVGGAELGGAEPRVAAGEVAAGELALEEPQAATETTSPPVMIQLLSTRALQADSVRDQIRAENREPDQPFIAEILMRTGLLAGWVPEIRLIFMELAVAGTARLFKVS